MRFPYHRQNTKYTCGAASMRMTLESLGIRRSEKQVMKLLCTNKIRGTWTKNFSVVAKKFMLKQMSKENATINDLKKYHKKVYAIIIGYFYPREKVDHYSILRKIGLKYIYFWDPWFGPDHKYKISYFKKIWKCDSRYEPKKAWFIAIKK